MGLSKTSHWPLEPPKCSLCQEWVPLYLFSVTSAKTNSFQTGRVSVIHLFPPSNIRSSCFPEPPVKHITRAGTVEMIILTTGGRGRKPGAQLSLLVLSISNIPSGGHASLQKGSGCSQLRRGQLSSQFILMLSFRK